MNSIYFLLYFVLAFTSSTSLSSSGSRLLVVVDDLKADKVTYSKFFNLLEKRKYSTTFATATDKSVSLISYDERNFDHLVLLTQTTRDLSEELTVASVLNFVNKGGNVLVTASSTVSETIRDFSFEFSIDFDDRLTLVKDPFHTAKENDIFSIYSDNFRGNKIIYTTKEKDSKELKPIAFKGLAHRLTNKNPLCSPVLLAMPSAYSFASADQGEIPENSPFLGQKIALVTSLQARNNARLIFSGSAAMFSDEFLDLPNYDNLQFVDEISKWVFQEKAVLRVKNAKHHRAHETQQHGIYRIKDMMEYSLDIQEFYNGKWNPFQGQDVQFEAKMLDPYIRRTLKPTPEGKFIVHFKLPDVYGVFTFKVEYNRHGYSWILSESNVQVRPYRHNDYDRFLSSAWPYYTSVFSLMAGFLVVASIWLFNEEKTVKK
ncbi:hypothetical protein HDU92_008955 [Lobulomyces angularis]|nr:hypothetical protein HDU92_008955 [Lobulomyces angularis]